MPLVNQWLKKAMSLINHVNISLNDHALIATLKKVKRNRHMTCTTELALCIVV